MNRFNLLGYRLLLSLAFALAVANQADELQKPIVPDWHFQTPETKEDLLTIQNRLQELLPQAREATVSVEGEGAGSGVIVSADGYILTAAHMIDHAEERLQITLPDGKRVNARAIGAIRFTDAGMAKMDDAGPWPFVPLAESAPDIGEWCFALGHPGGYDADRGIVVRLGRVISATGASSNNPRQRKGTLQTDCKIISGDSGGPLFNFNGEIIGIHSRISEDLDENLHVSVAAFHHDWKPLVAGIVFPRSTRPAGGFLGVHTRKHADGIQIEDVVKDSAAEKGGIQNGDIITRLEGFPMTGDIREFSMAIASFRPGEEIKVELNRAGEILNLEIQLGARSRF